MTSGDVRHLSQEQQVMAVEAYNRLSMSAGTASYLTDLENYADLLDQVGMHLESRRTYQEVILATKDKLIISRCHRKAITSFTAQRDFAGASASSDEALYSIQQIASITEEVTEELFRIHIETGFVSYFLYNFEKVEESVRQLRSLQHSIRDPDLRISFMHIVGLSLLMRYRWYKMPEEAFTHAEFFLQQARLCATPLKISLALCNAGFDYLWNEEIATSRQYFMEVVSLLREKHYSPLLMAYNYLALGYRMQNNISMTEQWTTLTLEKSIQTSNASYLAYSNANLAWIHAKRNNWLYAEDYARQAKSKWSTLSLIFSYAFVLIDCLVRKNELEEAGQYAYMLIHPKMKKLPDSITRPLHAAVASWIRNDQAETTTNLKDAIAESKISGYY